METVTGEAVLQWYHSLFSRRVDLVGDYAGSELFLIELDSLLVHCFSDPRLDFHDGFQLLHTVYVVEKLLRDLLSACNFNIVCFKQNEELCIPLSADPEDHSKYLLARSVIIRHLQQNLPSCSSILIRLFNSFTEAAFASYLKETSTYFVMCHDGATVSSMKCAESIPKGTPGKNVEAGAYGNPDEWSSPQTSSITLSQQLKLRAMISWFISKQYNVALINELKFMDTKAFTVVMEFSRRKDTQDFSAWFTTDPSNGYLASDLYCLNGMEQLDHLSEREMVAVLALRSAIEGGQVSCYEASSFLLHTSALQFLPLINRRVPKPDGITDMRHFITAFTQSATSLLRHPAFLAQLGSKPRLCDLADLVDGFFLTMTTHNSEFCLALLINMQIKAKFEALCVTLSQLCGKQIVSNIASSTATYKANIPSSPISIERAVLPFKNPVFDTLLAPVHLQIDDEPTRATLDQSKVFQELSHWHNHDRTIMPKAHPTQVGWFARRRNQWLMAEMQAYAASLTDTAGKILEPEIIIAGKSTQPSKSESESVKPQQRAKETSSKGSRTPGNSTKKKGGKAAAVEAAAAVKAAREQSKAGIDAAFWNSKCREILSQPSPQLHYTLARSYLQSLNTTDLRRPEVELFMIDCLLRIWADSRKSDEACAGLEIAALIWDVYLRLSKAEVGMTTEIIAALETISKALGLPAINFQSNCSNRPLAFSCLIAKSSDHKYLLNADLSLPCDSKTFQLEQCGPYLDRTIDSAPDARVPFHPDAWQRKVLDAIDNNESLFVVAPTSAGKTFISFYAMKKILQSSNDSVVVYVAPTKALVNQIAAEIQARFSKAFKYPGRSVWGIHTRDYRVNNPTGCQILVTVPHILQIMLLAPSHAERTNSWSCRIKRIIFDEVHCIGQADDGVIWEQLLLQAPCPIIALSATVGIDGGAEQ